MKDCRCGRILRCYSGKKFRIHEELEKIKAGDETHDKVYELNKQMCDIGKTMSDVKWMMDDIVRRAEENIRLYNDNNKYARFVRATYESKFGKPKGIIMEEKKTMTKAEAFEYLKGKKVNAKDKDRVVQMKMFDCDIKWRGGESAYYNFGSFLFIDNEGFLSHCGNDEEYWKRHAYEEISANDILSIEIVDENKKTEEEEALDKISCLGAQIVDILLHMKGHHHVTITETTVALYDEGMCLFHSDLF